MCGTLDVLERQTIGKSFDFDAQIFKKDKHRISELYLPNPLKETAYIGMQNKKSQAHVCLTLSNNYFTFNVSIKSLTNRSESTDRHTFMFGSFPTCPLKSAIVCP